MTIYTPVSAAEILGHINGTGGYTRASHGDTITIPAGTFDCTSAAMSPLPGVKITGAGKNKTTLLGRIASDLAGGRSPLIMSRLKVDGTGTTGGTYGTHQFANGTYYLSDMELIGGNAGAGIGNCVTFVAVTHPCRAMAMRVVAHTSTADIFSTKAPGSGLGAQSSLTLISCEGYGSGSASNDQILTAHDGYAIHDYYGYYHGAVAGGTIIPDVIASTQIYLFGTRVHHEGSNATVLQCRTMRDCVVTFGGSAATPTLYTAEAQDCEINNIVVQVLDSTSFTLRRCAISTRGVIVLACTTVIIDSCAIKGVTATNAAGITLQATFAGTATITNNLITNCFRNYYFRTENDKTITFGNNVGWAPTSRCVYVFGASGTITWSGGGTNQLSGTLEGYSLLAGDTTPADATDAQKLAVTIMDQTGFPITPIDTVDVVSANHVRIGQDNYFSGDAGTLAVPAAGSVLDGVAVDATTGTYVTVAASDVRDGVTFGAASALTGTVVLPDVGDVALNVGYGEDGVEFVGALVTSSNVSILSTISRGPGVTLSAFVGETITQSITLYETDGTTPIVLTGKTLAIVFETRQGGDVAVVDNADITVSGTSDNVVTFAYPSAATSAQRVLKFALRDAAAPKTVYLQGLLNVTRAPSVDPAP
jgi:hypothetical protein